MNVLIAGGTGFIGSRIVDQLLARGGHRVLVMTRDPLGQFLHSVICAPITSTIRGLATEVSLGHEAGLLQDSVANFDNIFLLSRARLLRRLGRVPASSMEDACRALATATGCQS